MADTTMNLKLSADISALTAGLADAQAGLERFNDDVCQLAADSRAAGAATSVDLGGGFTQVAEKTDAASAGTRQVANQTKAQAAEVREITQTMMTIPAPKPAVKPSNTPGFLALLGLDDTEGRINAAMDAAQSTYEQRMAQLQAKFAADGGEGQLADVAQKDVASHTSGKDIQQQLAGMNQGQNDTAALAKDFDQQVKLQTAFAAQSQQISAQGAAAWRRNWESATAPINSAFTQSINGVITGTESLQKAEKKAAQSIVLSYIDSSEKMVVKWATDRLAELTMTSTTETAKTAVVSANATEREASQAASSGGIIQSLGSELAQFLGIQTTKESVGNATSALTSAQQIQAAAAVASANTFASISAIPVTGPALAPAAAAAAFTQVEAMQSLVAVSAEGGLERVPYDGLPAILHADETVMPAHVANPMRNFFSDYQGATAASMAGGGSGGGDTHVHVQYAPSVGGRLSRSEFEGALRDHAGVLARHVGNAFRNSAAGLR